MKIIRTKPAEAPGQIDLEVTITGAEADDRAYLSLTSVAALGNEVDEKSGHRVKTQGAKFWENVFFGPIMIDVRKRVDPLQVLKLGEFKAELF